MKLYKQNIALIFLLSGFLLIGCKDDKENPVEPTPPLTPEELFYTNCGKIPPVLGCINAASYFVPNGITANNDGVNDIFMVWTNYDAFEEVSSFKVFNEVGDMMYEASNFPPNSTQYGWDGKQADGSLEDGIFNYIITLKTIAGESISLEGSVCVRTSYPLQCVEHEEHIAWGTQHTGTGSFHTALPSYEDCE